MPRTTQDRFLACQRGDLTDSSKKIIAGRLILTFKSSTSPRGRYYRKALEDCTLHGYIRFLCENRPAYGNSLCTEERIRVLKKERTCIHKNTLDFFSMVAKENDFFKGLQDRLLTRL